MNRTDRLLAIVLELQRHTHRYLRAHDLAATFEVSKRTIYRDIDALCAAGVPIMVAARQGYALVDGYFLPPLSLSADEALILAIGSDLIAESFDEHYRGAARSAARKIDAVLSADLRERVAELRRGLDFRVVRQLSAEQLRQLQLLRRAVADRRRVRFRYRSRNPESGAAAETTREVDPLRLTRHADDWYLTAHCHLRHALRVFRLGRINMLELLDTHYEDRAAIEGAVYAGADPVYVLAHFDAESALWVRESLPGTLIEECETLSGLELTFIVQPGQALMRWLLGWGAAVRVIEPSWLRSDLIAQAQRSLAGYQQDPRDR